MLEGVDEHLVVMDGSALYKVDPDTGSYSKLTTGWSGSPCSTVL
jgi:hypothetical protein